MLKIYRKVFYSYFISFKAVPKTSLTFKVVRLSYLIPLKNMKSTMNVVGVAHMIRTLIIRCCWFYNISKAMYLQNIFNMILEHTHLSVHSEFRLSWRCVKLRTVSIMQCAKVCSVYSVFVYMRTSRCSLRKLFFRTKLVS